MTGASDRPGDGDRLSRWSARQMDRLKATRARVVLRALLLGQLGLAVALVWTDIAARDPFASTEPIAPAPTAPPDAGDQTRPYHPTRIPVRPGADGPRTPLPAHSEGLQFSRVEVPGHGPALYLRGAIRPGDDARFERHVDGLVEPPARVALHSPGGAVEAALQIGRSIRQRGMDTHVLAEDACVSACPFLLAGGATRSVHRDAWIGLHQVAFVDAAALSAADAARRLQVLKADVYDYWAEMGVDPAIEAIAMRIPPERAYFLLPDELTELRLATAIVGD
ncbi:MAG: hypothetical protein ACK4WC_13025 [Rubrimonas sp.]